MGPRNPFTVDRTTANVDRALVASLMAGARPPRYALVLRSDRRRTRCHLHRRRRHDPAEGLDHASSQNRKRCAIFQSLSLSPFAAWARYLIRPGHNAAAVIEPHVAPSIWLGIADVNLQRGDAIAAGIGCIARPHPTDRRACASAEMVGA
jgi:hypothetical protein